GKSRALPLVEGEERDERRAAVERLVGGDGAGDPSGIGVTELGGLGELAEGGQEIGPETPEEPEGRADHDVAEVDERSDVQDLDFQDVAGLRSLHGDGTRERMHLREVEREDAARRERRRRRADVERVPAQKLDRLALADRRRGRNVLVPAVMHYSGKAVDGRDGARG